MKYFMLILTLGFLSVLPVQAQEKKEVAKDSIKQHDLKEVTVKTTRLLFVTKNDTTVYDLDALNQKEGAMLRDAFEKLPGMTFRDGQLFHNGRQVMRVLINGMNFSEKDPMLALRVLPSYLMKDVKVYERKSDFAMMYGEDDGVRELVADVSVRRKYMGAWTGDFTLGGGTDERFVAKGFANTFADQHRVSLFGNANNINEQMWYSGDGGERAGETQDGDNRFYTPGGTFFWKTPQAMNQKGYFKIEGGVDYNKEQYDYASHQETEHYLSDGSLFKASDSKRDVDTDRFAGHVKMDWKATDKLSMNYLGSFDISRSKNAQDLLQASWNENPLQGGGDIRDTLQYLLTADTNQPNAIDLQHKQIGGKANRGFYNHTLGIRYAAKNRIYYNLSHKLNYVKNNSEEEENTYYKYFNEEDGRTRRIDRLLNKDGNELEQGMGARIMKYFDVEGFRSFITYLGYDYNRKETTSNEEGFLANHGIEDETTRNWKKWNSHHSLEASMSAGKGIYTLELKPCFNYRTDEMRYTKRGLPTINPTRDYCYFSFKSLFRIRTPKGGILAQYFITPKIPDIENFITYPDMADPQYIIMGNENLRRGTNHGVSAWYWYDFVKEKESGKLTRNLSGNVHFARSDYDVTTYTTYNRSTGVVTVKPVNVSGNWNAKFNLAFTTPLDVSQHFWLETSADASTIRTQTFATQTMDELSTPNDNQLYTYSLSVKPRLKFKAVDASVAYKLSLEDNEGSYSSVNDKEQWNHTIKGTFSCELPAEIHFDADCNYQNYAGFATAGKRQNWTLLNLSLERSFLKKKNLRIGLSAHDLLNQNDGIQQIYDATQLSRTYSKTIGRYGLLSVAYRFEHKPKK